MDLGNRLRYGVMKVGRAWPPPRPLAARLARRLALVAAIGLAPWHPAGGASAQPLPSPSPSPPPPPGFVMASPPPRASMGASDVLAVYPNRVVVIDPASPDDWGVIPVQGTAHSALWLMERHILLLHLPDRKAMVVIDTRPGSVSRYRVIASYESQEFSDRALRFALASGRVYLARDREAVLIFDPGSLLAKIGLYAVDFLPVVYSTLARVTLPDRILALEEGQLTVEWTRPRPGEVAAPRYIRLPYRPTGLLTHREGSLVYLACRAADGSGRILALDPVSLGIVRELALPHAITSMAWLDDGRICVLSAKERRFAILDLKTWSWSRVWTPTIPGTPIRLLSAAAPPSLPRPREGIEFGEVYEP